MRLRVVTNPPMRADTFQMLDCERSCAMLRVIQCAASGVLLVIPDNSHVLRNAHRRALLDQAALDSRRHGASTADHSPSKAATARLDDKT
jgi:hypothetical protein